MNQKQIAEIKAQIKAELAKTKTKVDEYRKLTQPIAPENAIGRISRMDAINNKSVNEAALRTAEAKLKGLEFALTKVDDNNFGQCVRCSKQIPITRILLMPHSRYCVHCAR